MWKAALENPACSPTAGGGEDRSAPLQTPRSEPRAKAASRTRPAFPLLRRARSSGPSGVSPAISWQVKTTRLSQPAVEGNGRRVPPPRGSSATSEAGTSPNYGPAKGRKVRRFPFQGRSAGSVCWDL